MENNVIRLKTRVQDSGECAYRLADGVQVRQEKFGLLFYSYRGPRLYFLPSKNLIGDDFFDGKQTLSQLVDGLRQEHGLPRHKIQDYVLEIFQSLQAKGLIHGQPLR